MSFLRLQYHHRKIAGASWAASELDYYTDPDMSWRWGNALSEPWSDNFDRAASTLGPNWTQCYSGSGMLGVHGVNAKWSDGPIFLEHTMDTPDGEKLLDLRVVP